MISVYDIIPATRANARWWSWLLWALFSNEDDGACGERSMVPGFGYWLAEDQRVSWRQFWRWWLRNPLHQLTWVVLAWPGGPLFAVPVWRGWYVVFGWRRDGALCCSLKSAADLASIRD